MCLYFFKKMGGQHFIEGLFFYFLNIFLNDEYVDNNIL